MQGTGELVEDASGALIPDDKTGRPICRRVACGQFDRPARDMRSIDDIVRDRPRVWPQSWGPVLDRYRMWSTLNIPPRSGGLRDQDWFEMRIFAAIRSAEESSKRLGQREMVARAGPIGGLIALTLMK